MLGNWSDTLGMKPGTVELEHNFPSVSIVLVDLLYKLKFVESEILQVSFLSAEDERDGK